MNFYERLAALVVVSAMLVLPAQAKKKKKVQAEPPKSAYTLLTGRDSLVMSGVMNVVTKGDTVCLELPTALLGRQFLVVNRLQKVPSELNESGVNKGINYKNQVVRFEWDKTGGTVTIRQQRVTPLVDSADNMAQSVYDNYLDPVLAVIKVRCVGPDSASVVFPVQTLFNGRDNCLNDVFRNVNIPQSANGDLSRILSVKSHRESVTATSELTTVVHEGNDRVNVTVVVSSTLLLLPEQPMQGREESARVGYFTDHQLSFSDSQQQTKTLHYINRWRLEPVDEAAYRRGELTEPKKPIVFYLDRRIPASLRPYVRQGILDWNAAFERAGFRDAVRVVEMTDSMEREDDDLKYSVVTYAASEKANAMGPCVTDPRSGEILEADIIWWHNVRKLLTQWLRVQTGGVNPAVRQAVLPDSLMGDAARFVATHEVGHSLGLRHNMRASSAYPTDSLRSPSFIRRVGGTSASIMDYARYNYVAQPGDGVTMLSPHIGPYDLMAIEWGYRWFPSEAEAKPALAEFLRRHDGAEYKYSETLGYRQCIDPRSMSEDLGDDPVKSARYGLANLKRIVPNMAVWTRTGEADQTWDDVAELWSGVISQWDLYNYHVLANVGGVYLENTVVDDGLSSFTYVPQGRQREAVRYLIEEVLTTPQWLFPADLTRKTYLLKNGREEHPLTALKNEQNYILWDLLANERLLRMIQAEMDLGSGKAFTANELVQMLHEAVFVNRPQPNVMERSVQKSMVDALITAAAENEGVKVNRAVASHESLTSRPRNISFTSTQISRTSDAISIKRAELLRIRLWAKARIGGCTTAVQMHCSDIVQRIETALGL
ncbi:MAG: zinc-dependent metalloprotease [Bacteroidaceae bacterium]|nr:zinc-dependent metalloprotease [Bacteroidaceae bacterium]